MTAGYTDDKKYRQLDATMTWLDADLVWGEAGQYTDKQTVLHTRRCTRRMKLNP